MSPNASYGLLQEGKIKDLDNMLSILKKVDIDKTIYYQEQVGFKHQSFSIVCGGMVTGTKPKPVLIVPYYEWHSISTSWLLLAAVISHPVAVQHH